MLERLIENWLDSAGERSYQRCFCQMLTGKGYRIVHNTEHTPLEFGKDVIATTPSGAIAGYQLKGHPGGTLKPRDFHEIRGQLEQLATLALAIPGLEGRVPDECYLVTNGEIDEAVYLQIQLLNASLEKRGHPPEKIKTIARGTLLEWARTLGLSLWPSEVADFGNLLRLLNCEGDETFPARVFDPLLQNTLKLQDDTTVPEVARRVTSAAVMTAVALHSFSRRKNYVAEISAWTMFATYAVSACLRHKADYAKHAREAVLTARDGIYDLMAQLCDDVLEEKVLFAGDPYSEFAFYRPRLVQLYGLLAIYWFWSEAEGWKRPEHKAALEGRVPDALPQKWLWGEAAIPAFLAFSWFKRRRNPSQNYDQEIAAVLGALVVNKLGGEGEPLAGPYYDIEEVVQHQYSQLLKCPDPFRGDGFERVSYFCESLLMCLVRAGLKDYCIQLWPNFSRVAHETVTPDNPWQYGLYRTGDSAVNETRLYPRTYQWADLRSVCEEHAGSGIPEGLRQDPFLLLLFVNIFPFRGSFSTMRFLHKQFDGRSLP